MMEFYKLLIIVILVLILYYYFIIKWIAKNHSSRTEVKDNVTKGESIKENKYIHILTEEEALPIVNIDNQTENDNLLNIKTSDPIEVNAVSTNPDEYIENLENEEDQLRSILEGININSAASQQDEPFINENEPDQPNQKINYDELKIELNDFSTETSNDEDEDEIDFDKLMDNQ